ncbi:pentapeptide repeat-containing protein [Leptolyngbyaceae cyanobacterium CCMR0082]|uniref:Pentapeptide repeat-containing protein n=1 Tax=Adonisia turfae CCMR0082 TaxID=2304604 RepID=A0A6M0SFF9_9CYAN|nr:pentapeptide repeat-containing protein [Adonisia turfae]NEZ67184.1 pentapeptide repeat-containing protein [Adonisia turfae CCMR0082]
MKLFRVLLTTAIILLVLQAETPLRVVALRATKNCSGCRLKGVRIQYADLTGADLSNADLRWAQLDSVNLNHANLEGANLRHARLYNVTTKGTNFCGAVLMDAVKGYCSQP